MRGFGAMALAGCMAACAAAAVGVPVVTAADTVHEAFDAQTVPRERAARRQRLRRALTAFDARLNGDFDAASRAAWHEYLTWDAWAAPLLSQGEFRIDWMKRASKWFYSANEGFDHPTIGELRMALAELVDLEEAVRMADGDLAGQFARSTATIEQALPASDADYAELETSVWWLATTGQTPRLLAQIRERYQSPVIVGQVRRAMFDDKLTQFSGRTTETRPTQRRIQGATVRGTSTIETDATVDLVPGASDARLRVTLRGQVNAPRNSSTIQRVSVVSSSTSQFEASADVYWNGEKFIASTPTATVDSRSRIRSIDAPLLLRGAASRRVYGSKASAEAEVASLVEREVTQALSERLSRAAEKLNARAARFLAFLKATGNDAQPWTTQLRLTEVVVGYLPRSRVRLAAPPYSPPPLEGDESIGLSFHDGALSGILVRQLAGAVWRDENFGHLQRELTGSNTEQMLVGLDPRRWSVAWSWRSPLAIEFKDQNIHVRYRFDRVTIDGVEHEAPVELRMRYSIEATSLGTRYRRLDLPELASLDAAHPLPAEASEFLVERFTRPTAETFRLDGLQFPPGGELDGLSGFQPVRIHFAPHWVHVTYARRVQTEYPQALDVATAR